MHECSSIISFDKPTQRWKCESARIKRELLCHVCVCKKEKRKQKGLSWLEVKHQSWTDDEGRTTIDVVERGERTCGWRNSRRPAIEDGMATDGENEKDELQQLWWPLANQLSSSGRAVSVRWRADKVWTPRQMPALRRNVPSLSRRSGRLPDGHEDVLDLPPLCRRTRSSTSNLAVRPITGPKVKKNKSQRTICPLINVEKIVLLNFLLVPHLDRSIKS